VNKGAILATVITLAVYEGVLWLWFAVSPTATLPGLALVPFFLFYGAIKLLFSEPGTGIAGLVAIFPAIIWLVLFHGLPAIGAYKFWNSVGEKVASDRASQTER